MSSKSKKDVKSAAEYERLLKEKDARIDELMHKLDRMNEIMLNMQRAQFGQRSEKQIYVSPDQLSIFNEAEMEQDPKASEPDEDTIVVPEHKRRKKRPLKDRMKELPVEEIFLELPDDQKYCKKCGAALRQMGVKFLRKELVVIPKQIKLVNYYTYTYTCDECEKEGVSRITSVEAPKPLLKHSYASPSLVTDVLVQKYVDGIPLARQEKIWEREGFDLSRATMANWVIKVAEKWLKPIYRQMKRQLLSGKVIYADETVVQVLKEDGKSASSESRMWVYCSDSRSNHQIRIFEYQPGRNGEYADRFLKEFLGILMTDGYIGYNKVSDVIRCCCWVHMRRKWREAMPKDATTETSKAAIGYKYCNKLFALEKQFKDLDDTERLSRRQQKSLKIVDEYYLWVRSLDPVKGSKLAEAVTYALNQENNLRECFNHGEVEIHANLAENSIRPFVIGRNYALNPIMFCTAA